MGAILTLLENNPRAIWLDAHAYAEHLLANDAAPWLDAAGFVAWQRKAQGLLKPDVAVLPVAAIVKAWIAAHPELRSQMASKSRVTYPLKTLLADEALRAHLVELAQGLRAGIAGVPLALVLSSPRAAVACAYVQAHHASAEVGEEEVDSAAMYMADFLRAFGEAGIDALLLEEAAGYMPASDQELEIYQSVLNVAAHYRWDAGLRLEGEGFAHLPPGCAFAIAPHALNGTPTAIALGAEFWNGSEAPPAGFHFSQVPHDATPERVLQRLASLR